MRIKTNVQVIAGLPGSGKRRRLTQEYLGELQRASDRQTLDAVLWIAPNSFVAEEIRNQLLPHEGGHLSPGIRSLQQLADALIGQSEELVRPFNRCQQSWLVEEVITRGRQANKLQLLGDPTPGAIDLVVRVLANYAHADLAGEAAREQAEATGDRRQIEFAQVYQDYLALLRKHRLYDAPTRLALADSMIAKGDIGPFHKLQLVVASDLEDLTPLEWRLLSRFLSIAPQALLSLSIDWSLFPDKTQGDVNGSELFQNSIGFLSRAIESFPVTQVETLPTRRSDWPARDRLRDWLFRDPRKVPGGEIAVDGRLRVLASASGQDEMRDVARCVKRLLQAGESPAEIVLATRRTNVIAERARQAFEEVGVPLAIEGAVPLEKSPLVRAINQLLRLASSDWRYDDLISAVTSPRFTALAERPDFSDPLRDELRRHGFVDPRSATEWFLRERSLPGGRQATLEQAAWLTGRWRESLNSSDETGAERLPHRAARLEAAAALSQEPLARLAKATERLKDTAPPLVWWDRLRQSLIDLGYQLSPSCGREAEESDSAAAVALEEALVGLERLARWRKEELPRLSAREVARLFRGWMTRLTLSRPGDSEGRVRLLSAESARSLRPRHMFVVALAENAFPGPEPPGQSLAPGGERARRRRHASHEMLLFYDLVLGAQESLVLSFTSQDATGQPLHPSSYLAEVERLLAPHSLRGECTGRPSWLCPTDFRNHAVRELVQGRSEAFSHLAQYSDLKETAHSIASGVLISHERSHGEAFGAAEGMVIDDESQMFLSRRYGSDHLWSPTQLELYGTCPFKFFMRQVLSIEPVGELDLDVDYRRRGSLMHDAMVRFHRRLDGITESGQKASDLEVKQFLEAFTQAVEAAHESRATVPHEAPLAEIEARQAASWSKSYHQQHQAYDLSLAKEGMTLTPSHFEARFGPRHADAEQQDDDLSHPEPYRLLTTGEPVLLTGQVDRLDTATLDGQTLFNVIDYKTGKVRLRLEDVQAGRKLQLVLYTLAVQEHLLADQNALPWRIGYWGVQKEGFKTGRNFPQPGERGEGGVVSRAEWESLCQRVRNLVEGIVLNVRSGQFPMCNVDDKCGGTCEYRSVCRVAQARSAGKTFDPTASQSES